MSYPELLNRIIQNIMGTSHPLVFEFPVHSHKVVLRQDFLLRENVLFDLLMHSIHIVDQFVDAVVLGGGVDFDLDPVRLEVFLEEALLVDG